MRYCESCILPDTRPGLELDAEGVCSACRSHATKGPDTDWEQRGREFAALAEEVRSQGRPWDCVVPVSGGKDSTWQVATCLEHGLRVLAVTWRTPGRTPLGGRNLRNLIDMGVDHIDFSVNPVVERRFLLRSLERFATTAIPMHLAIFNVPTTVAARYDVPLVVWGENSALEYVGDDQAGAFDLTGDWVRRYGAVHGTTAADWVSDDLTERDLAPYFGPTDDELRERGVRAVFLGMFFEWDPVRTFEVASAHGFESREQGALTGVYDFADVDDEFISLHHHLKWHKFGFTRAWDNLSLEIRNGRLTRKQAIATLRELGDQTPHSNIEAFCAYVGISREQFDAIGERFRNTDIWEHDADGTWRIPGFLIEDWPWAGEAVAR